MVIRQENSKVKLFSSPLGATVICVSLALAPIFFYFNSQISIVWFYILLLSVFWSAWIFKAKKPEVRFHKNLKLAFIALCIGGASWNEVLLNSFGYSNLMWAMFALIGGFILGGRRLIWVSIPLVGLTYILAKWLLRYSFLHSLEPNAVEIIFSANWISSMIGLFYLGYILFGRDSNHESQMTLVDAAQSDERKRELISSINKNIVRKFLEPLKVIIKSNSALMNLKSLDSEAQDKITMAITNSSARILSITKTLLKISGDEKEVQLVLVSVTDLIEDAVNSFSQSRNIDYLVYSPNRSRDTLTVLANRHELREAIFVLLQNSFESVQKAQVKKIHIKSYRVDNMVVIEVLDSGAGISLEIKDQIFNPFFSTKEIGGGTGLGLSLARSVLNSFGGTIRLDSAMPGKCVFVLEIPLANGDDL